MNINEPKGSLLEKSIRLDTFLLYNFALSESYRVLEASLPWGGYVVLGPDKLWCFRDFEPFEL